MPYKTGHILSASSLLPSVIVIFAPKFITFQSENDIYISAFDILTSKKYIFTPRFDIFLSELTIPQSEIAIFQLSF